MADKQVHEQGMNFNAQDMLEHNVRAEIEGATLPLRSFASILLSIGDGAPDLAVHPNEVAVVMEALLEHAQDAARKGILDRMQQTPHPLS